MTNDPTAAVAAIPLDQLFLWDGNARKTGASDGIEELKASIAAHGVLQSLVVQRTKQDGYAVVAGQRRFLALSALAEAGALEADAPVPCRVLSASADAAEVSLTENVVRSPMHPADQFEAFRDLVDAGASMADVAARFGIAESAVKKRLKLARISPRVMAAYRSGELTLEHVQAFAISDDHAAQDEILDQLSHRNADPEDIRAALTENEIPATDKRARFVTLETYELAGGAIRRDLFAEGEDGVFLLDTALLDTLAAGKLQTLADALTNEGWKWTMALPELDYDTRGGFRCRHPERLPLSDEAQAEHQRLVEEHEALFAGDDELDEAASERIDAIEARIEELEDTQCVYSPEVLAIAGALITIGWNGEPEILRGLVRPEDEPTDARPAASKPRPPFSAALVQSLTEARSAAIGALLARDPNVALVAVTHTLACDAFRIYGSESSLQLSARITHLREATPGASELDATHEHWLERLPSDIKELWDWCLAQEQSTLLELLAYCAARTVNAAQTKADRSDAPRLAHANVLAEALALDMTQWFTPSASNFFRLVSRATVAASICEAKGIPPRRSWDKLKKSELAALAERETAGTGWLPQPLRR